MKSPSINKTAFSSASLRMATLLCFAALISLDGLAQSPLFRGNGSPTIRKGPTWYLDTLGQVAWHRLHGKWSALPATEVTDIQLCHGLAHIYSTGGNTIWNGSLLVAKDFVHCFCGDSLRVVAYRGITTFYNPSGAELHAAHCGPDWAFKDTLAGMRAFCVPHREETGQKLLDCAEIHSWGMYGGSGRWLIPPIYDMPFHFHDGFADVIYYGEKRKINEQGATVEKATEK